MKYLGLGKRLRRLRDNKGISLALLSEKTSIPLKELETYEEDKALPKIGNLVLLAKALEVNVADILRERESSKNFEIIRSSDRKRMSPLLDPEAAKTMDYAYEPLTTAGVDKHLDAYLIEVPAKQAKKPHQNLTHPGEEFVYMLEGKVVGEISGDNFELEAGDSLFLRSSLPHQFYNPYDKVARALTVIYPY